MKKLRAFHTTMLSVVAFFSMSSFLNVAAARVLNDEPSEKKAIRSIESSFEQCPNRPRTHVYMVNRTADDLTVDAIGGFNYENPDHKDALDMNMIGLGVKYCPQAGSAVLVPRYSKTEILTIARGKSMRTKAVFTSIERALGGAVAGAMSGLTLGHTAVSTAKTLDVIYKSRTQDVTPIIAKQIAGITPETKTEGVDWAKVITGMSVVIGGIAGGVQAGLSANQVGEANFYWFTQYLNLPGIEEPVQLKQFRIESSDRAEGIQVGITGPGMDRILMSELGSREQQQAFFERKIEHKNEDGEIINTEVIGTYVITFEKYGTGFLPEIHTSLQGFGSDDVRYIIDYFPQEQE